jgi:hypothetical protein
VLGGSGPQGFLGEASSGLRTFTGEVLYSSPVNLKHMMKPEIKTGILSFGIWNILVYVNCFNFVFLF